MAWLLVIFPFLTPLSSLLCLFIALVVLLCLANPFAEQHPLSARLFTEKFFPHSSLFPCSLALLSPFGSESTAAFTLIDSDRARGHGHHSLSTCWNLLLSSGLSVLIPSDFIAAFFWFESLLRICISFLPFIFFSPSLTTIEPHPPNSENIPSKKLLFDSWLCWWVDGKAYAVANCWSKDHHPSSLQSAHLHPQNTGVDRPPKSMHPAICDNKQQHGNLLCRTVPDKKKCTISH